MRTIRSVLCGLGFHKRRRSVAYRQGDHAHSNCRGCCRSMVKDERGWRLGFADS